MLIKLKNKDKLIVDHFTFKCCIGKKGIKNNKKEGDKSTPVGIFQLGNVYYRSDRVKKPLTKLKCIKIYKNMGWCNDPHNKFYNKKIKTNKKIKHEKLFRRDYKYNYLIIIKYNYLNSIPGKGSAIFLHLTKNYKPTDGCIGLKEKDLLILLKLVNKKTKIKIN
tara:strand:+ start:1098 stop:1589 length:492 start_codon:yes stop_codon:yes gene_type:complete